MELSCIPCKCDRLAAEAKSRIILHLFEDTTVGVLCVAVDLGDLTPVMRWGLFVPFEKLLICCLQLLYAALHATTL